MYSRTIVRTSLEQLSVIGGQSEKCIAARGIAIHTNGLEIQSRLRRHTFDVP